MKKIFYLLGFLLVFTMLTGCSDDKETLPVDENGLTPEINDLVSEDILSEMKRLGLEINGGANPPNIEGSYLFDALTLLSSNRDDDTPGDNYLDQTYTFSTQDGFDIIVNSANSQSAGEGFGSFIVGDGNTFSVFIRIESERSGCGKSLTVQVISGTITSNGIENAQVSIFMIDDGGDPCENLIDNGEGRVIDEADGLARRR